MDDVAQLLSAARTSTMQLVARSRELLAHGADLRYVQDDYIAVALVFLEDAEAYGVLAATGDASALAAIERVIEKLEALHDKLSRELADQDDLEGDL
jgi:hypothetical protein